jgi:hypothetical protein
MNQTFDEQFPPRRPGQVWIDGILKRPEGFIYYGEYNLFRRPFDDAGLFQTWGMCWSRPMNHTVIQGIVARLAKKLGPDGMDSGWALIRLSDKFMGRGSLHSIVCRVYNDDGTLHKAAVAVYLEERNYYKRHRAD